MGLRLSTTICVCFGSILGSLVSGINLQYSSSELASFWRCNLVLDLSKRLSQDLHKQK